MNPLAIMALVQQAMQLVPIAIQLGSDVQPFIGVLKDVITGTALTADQRAVIDAQMESLHAQIQAAPE
jgi:hypothetical protein